MNADLKETLGRRIIEATHLAVAMHLNEATQLRRAVSISGAGRSIGGADRMVGGTGYGARQTMNDSVDGGGFLRHGDD